MDFRIFIGWDQENDEAAAVCRHSLQKLSGPLDISLLDQTKLRQQGLYWRGPDVRATTDFSLTRFLVPELTGFTGQAVYMDADFLWLRPIQDMMHSLDPEFAVHVVQHQYQPIESHKKSQVPQWRYPKKNWSSLMVFDCGRVPMLDRYLVNTVDPGHLHQFRWIENQCIGHLDHRWNWLEGWYREPNDGQPWAVHFTRGGPWLESCTDVSYAELWRKHKDDLRRIDQEIR